MSKKKRLGDLLVEAGIIDKMQLRAALGQQAKWGKTLGRTLLEMRVISEAELLPILSEQLNMPAIDISARRIDPDVAALLDEEFCRNNECIPFQYHEQGKFLDMAMTDAQSAGLFDQVRVRTKCNVRPFLAGPEAIREAIDRAFGEDDLRVTPQFMLTENVFDLGEDGPDPDEAEQAPAGKAVSVVARAAGGPPAGPPRRERRLTPGNVPHQVTQLRRHLQAMQEHMRRQDRFMRSLTEQLRLLFGDLAARGVLNAPEGHPLVGPATAPRPRPPSAPHAAATELPPLAVDPPASEGQAPAHDSGEIDVDVIFDGVDLDLEGMEEPAGGRRPEAEQVKPAEAPDEVGDALPLVHVPPGSPSVVAMDLGTTRSSVAAVVDGQVQVFKLPGDAWDMPSMVGFRQDGSVMLGKAARKMLASDPNNAISSPKRLLGRRFDERALQPYIASLGIKALKGPRGEVLLQSRGKTITITEACGHILTLLRLVAQKHLGREVHDVILTTPVSFTEQQYAALGEAARLADLRVVEFVEEPVAATLACVSDPLCHGLVAVYDFGGGTFDFSVVDVGADKMEVITSAGDSWLGGDDFDEALASAAANGFWQQTQIELRNQSFQWQRLMVRAEATKRALSDVDESTLELKGAALTKEGTLDLLFPVSRAQLAQLSQEIVDRSLETCREALSLNDLKPTDLNAVYLSGGTTYIPAVRDAVTKFFGKKPRSVVPPERAVLIGAAVHGALYPEEVARDG